VAVLIGKNEFKETLGKKHSTYLTHTWLALIEQQVN
jgi:hypothetical protein